MVDEPTMEAPSDVNSMTLQIVSQATSFADFLEANGRDKREIADTVLIATMSAALFYVRRFQVPQEMVSELSKACGKSVNDDEWFNGLEEARLNVLAQMKGDRAKRKEE